MNGSKTEESGRTVAVKLETLGALALAAILILTVALFVTTLCALGYARQSAASDRAFLECKDARIAAQAKVEQVEAWVKLAHPAGGMGGGR